jgi:hypothetical protein
MQDNNENLQTETNVQSVEVENLDDILGIPGASNVMLPGDDEAKPNLFTTPTTDIPGVDEDDEKKTSDNIIEEIVNEEINDENTEEVEKTTKTGRPKVEKNGLVELTKKLMDKKVLFGFDDDKPIEDYTIQDFEELLEANIKEVEKKVAETVPAEFFESLPQELQIAAKYVADGGNDLKGLFRTLAQVEEIHELDPAQENDQEQIVRNYLYATKFGTAEDIEEEINAWKDRGELENKANKFKPKLDAMNQQLVAAKLQQQELTRKQQQEQAQAYIENVYGVLEPGELNGIKLDKKIQNALYAGLVQPNYPSITGKPTNLLGHLLEKYQWVEPRHDLIAEALWLLSDPDGYKSKIKEGVTKEVVNKTVRTLKTEEANKNSFSTQNDTADNNKRNVTKIKRDAGGSFFKRS